MKFTAVFLSMLILVTCIQGHTSSPLVQSVVDRFYAHKEKESTAQNKTFAAGIKINTVKTQLDCHPGSDGPSCAEVACKKLGTWGCDNLDKLKEVNRACRGNYNGVCVEAACQYLGTWGCDNMTKVTEVARACVGNYDSSCLAFSCKSLGTWGCDNISKLKEVLRSCAGD